MQCTIGAPVDGFTPPPLRQDSSRLCRATLFGLAAAVEAAAHAGLTWDFYPLHTDEEYARQTRFGTRIAHGPLVYTVSIGLMPIDFFDCAREHVVPVPRCSLSAVWKKAIARKAPAHNAVGNVGRDAGTLVFNGKFETADLITGEVEFSPLVGDRPSKHGTFKAVRGGGG